MKGKTKQEKGITLIALIITIVVLLILAVVAINSITNTDLIAHAGNSTKTYNNSVTNEQTILGGYQNYLKNHIGGGVKEDEVTMLGGEGQTYYTLAPSTLSFRSSADINDFQEVQINGVTLDQSNYTITEGSTIVKLSIDYLKTLEEGDYSISIVSKTGSTSAGFSIVKPDVNSHGFYYNQPYTAYVSVFGGNTAVFIRNDGTLGLIVADTGYTEICDYSITDNQLIISAVMGTFTVSFSNNGNEAFVNELGTSFVLGDESFAADEDYIYIYDSSLGGYVVNPINRTKASYSPIRTGINGMPTVALNLEMFDNNTNLIAIPQIPSSINIIGTNAFRGCTGLTNVVIPDSIRMIGTNAFSDCTQLSSVTLPAGIQKMYDGVFYNCTNLTNITFEGTIEQWNAIQKTDDLFFNVPAIEVVCSNGTVTL